MSILEGPSADAESGTKNSLVILLHGYGADGNDLFGIAQALAQHLPNTAFRSPNAPERCTTNPAGYQWFPISWLDGSSEQEMAEGAERAKKTLHAYLDEAMAEEGMTPDRTVIIGFSQGTMMSLDVTMRRDEAFAGLVGFSGRLIESDAPMTCKTPVLLVHGDQDPMVPVASIHEAREALEKADVPVLWHISEGVGHGIAPDGLGLALKFIQDRLG
ncbi:MAG: prolyl oligopeptidase family serine peptidase [Paracoccaceae bacterium]|nr:prolyl oligopeptidase family serine peptidase [Paracoccaceae bacterium]MDG1371727.1 prolyl oligopeptidase family serine peptidase [Paracoccaceae bacterium]